MAKQVALRAPGNFDSDENSALHGLSFEGVESLTRQSERDDADINVLVKRFGVTGSMPVSVKLPTYGDFDGITDYQSALNAVRGAAEAFMELPAELRSRFENDPQVYLQFVTDEKNLPEMRKLGLAKELPSDIKEPNPPAGEKPA